MADKKISELTNITGANLADGDELVVVDASASETKAITFGEFKTALDTSTGFVRITGDTMTGDLALSGADITFGDNDKAIFGAGSDLQIYHDGSYSRIHDEGTGSLILQTNGTNVSINSTGKNMGIFTKDGSVDLYYDGVKKLATTSTGIDVTGTVTADGLTVDGGATTEIKVFSQGRVNPTTLSEDASGAELMVGSSNPLTLGTASTDRLNIANNGDISFYEDTGTTAKFFWDASAESLGIGTTNPSSLDATANDLVVGGGTGNKGLTVFSGTGSTGAVVFADGNDGTVAEYRGWMSYDHSTDALRFASASTERMRIDSSGSVGIGTSSPSEAIHVLGGKVKATNGADTVYQLISADNNGGVLQTGSNAMRFFTSGSEAARIDASGNLLVGTTTTNTQSSSGGTNTGTWINSAGIVNVGSNSNAAAYLNRQSTDGDIAVFRKNGSTVGSIKARSAFTTLQIGNLGTGITGTSSHTIVPSVTNSRTDATVSLGQSFYRFRDLYLSGGVYLGGTGAANKLDDYEEGTWDPTFLAVSGSFGSITYDAFTKGAYTRIGRVVYITGTIRTDAITVGTASTGVRVSGLPFTVAANDPVTSRNMLSPLALSDQTSFASDSPNRAEFSPSATSFVLQKQSSISSDIALLVPSDLGTGANANRLAFSGFYFTDA